MYLVMIAWVYVVLMMAVVEATSSNGTVLGAIFTFLLYGALPLSIVMYLLGTPGRRRARHAAEALKAAEQPATPTSAADPDHRSHAAGDPVAPEGKEP
jgi:hypothetical protein